MRPSSRSPLVVLRARWPLLLGTALLVSLVTLGLSLAQSKTWTSSVVLQLTPQSPALALDPTVVLTPGDPARRLATETQAVLSDAVLEPATARLRTSADDLRQRISVTPSQDADTFVISVRGSTPAEALTAASIIADLDVRASLGRERARLQSASAALNNQRRAAEVAAENPGLSANLRTDSADLARRLTGRQAQLLAQRDLAQASVEIVSAASIPTADGLGAFQAGVLGAVAGALLGLAMCFLRDLTDGRLRDANDVSAQLAGTPVVTVPFPRRRTSAARRLFGAAAAADHSAAVQRLHVAVTGLSSPPAHRSVLVTGPTTSDSRSRLTVDLGASLAAAGLRCVVVDADTSRGKASAILHADVTPGLTDLQAVAPAVPTSGSERPEPVSARQLLQPTAHPGLLLLPRGMPTVDPSRRLRRGSDLVKLLDDLRDQADVVLIDGPVLAATERFAAASVADTVLLVVDVGRRGARAASLALTSHLLASAQADVAATVALPTVRRRRTRGGPPVARSSAPVRTGGKESEKDVVDPDVSARPRRHEPA